MWMRTTHMTERTRWLIGSGLMFAWTFGISAWTLTRYGYGIHDWLWWLVCAVVGAAVSLTVGWISVFTTRQIVAAQRDAVAGLDQEQLDELARAWKRGPVPDDPAVLVAVLRRRDLLEHYRRRTLRMRFVVAALLGVRAFAAVLVNFTRHNYGATVLILALWVVCLLAVFWSEIREKLRRPRLMQLRAAADHDPQVSAAITDPVTPMPRPNWRWWTVAFAVIVALVYGGLLGTATYFSPKERGCRVARSVVHDIYANREWFWTTNMGPTGRPLDDYQHLAQQLRDNATAAEGFPDIAPHARRIAELADRAATIVATARQQTDDVSRDALRHDQTAYAQILDAVANEEKPLAQTCWP